MSLYDQPLLDLHDELIIDLFAGGGGASSGIEQALGRMVDIAINHDAAAISLHEANHPQTQHFHCDVFEVDPRLVCRGRKVGLLWASPDCTYHSKARGGKPIRSKFKKRRALAWVIKYWAGTVRPRVIIGENVEEFKDWGPLIGPKDALRPCPKRRGKTYRKFVRDLRALGYEIEWRELRACDYGAPTIRKRWFFIARCDGQPIVFPQPTHGVGLKPYRTAAECIDWSIPMLSIFADKAEAKVWAWAYQKPTPVRPLAENTMRRVARGVKRFVLDNPKPFLVTLAHSDVAPNGRTRWGKTERDIDIPFGSVTASNENALIAPHIMTMRNNEKPFNEVDKPLHVITAEGAAKMMVAPFLQPRYGEREGQAPRCVRIDQPSPVVVPGGNGGNLVAANLISYHDEQGAEARAKGMRTPIDTLDCSNRFGLVASFLAQYNGGFADGNSGDGHHSTDPLSTIATKGPYQGVVAAFLDQANNGFDNRTGRMVDLPLSTILSQSRGHQGLIAAHIQRDFGTSTGHRADVPIGCLTSDGGGKAGLVASFLSRFNGNGEGSLVDDPIGSLTSIDRFGLVNVEIDGQQYFIADIAMRMLQPRELYLCQGFRPGYIIDRGADGKPLTKTEQVRMVGNSVSPPCAEALVAANCAELVARRAA